MIRNLLLFVVLIYFASSPLHFYLLLILTMSYNHPDRLISFIIIYIIVYIIIYIIIYVINLFHVKLFIKGHNKISSQESACIFTIIEVLFIKIVLKKYILTRIFSNKKNFMFYVFSEGKTSKLCEILQVTRFRLGKRFFLIP